MKFNEKLNSSYYADYVPCNCEACENYYLQIKEKFPGICAFLEHMNVNPLKPFELIWDNEGEDYIYFGCQYLVFGELQEDYKEIIDGVEITENKYFHPSTGVKEEHFILDFGPIRLKNIKGGK